MVRVVLASGSPRRRELLRQIGLEFEVIPALGEETVTTETPQETVCELSAQKAREVCQRLRAAAKKASADAGADCPLIVIGADTVVCQDGRIMGKPSSRQEAVRMLESLQGRKHSVFTGVTVLIGCPGEEMDCRTFCCETKVEVYPMRREDIERYAETGEPMDKAGAYGIQGRFAAWVKAIEGDYNNVVGLPVSALWQVIGPVVTRSTRPSGTDPAAAR